MSQPSSQILDNLTWRCIGPPRGGRVVAVAGHRAQPHTFYFGAVAGGVWRHPDGPAAAVREFNAIFEAVHAERLAAA